MEEDPMQRQYGYQEALQRQQIDAQQGMSAPAILQQQQMVQAALVEQTNPEHVLKEIELKLKGFRLDNNGELQKQGEPLMNQRGIGRLLFLISSIVTQNTILSHLEEKEISNLIIRIGDDIIDDLTLNWKEYGIQDKIMLDQIVDSVLFPSFMALKRAWKQNEKNWLNKTVVESISTSPTMQHRQGRFMSRFKL